jgi:hypothetical protein
VEGTKNSVDLRAILSTNPEVVKRVSAEALDSGSEGA